MKLEHPLICPGHVDRPVEGDAVSHQVWLLGTEGGVFVDPILVSDAPKTISLCYRHRPVKVDVCRTPNCVKHSDWVRCVTEVDSKLYRRHINVFWLFAL
jgi:hypothetical protein